MIASNKRRSHPPHQATQLVRYRMRHALGRCPGLYLPLARLRNARTDLRRVVGPRTELVIEGFPRSANTFAVTAFRRAQARPVEVAHHLHLAAQVLYGLRRGIPVLVLIREPVAAITSYMLHSKYPDNSPVHAFNEYLRFYETLRPWRGRFVVGCFDEVVHDFGMVTQRLNAHYATGFTPFIHTPANVQACFSEVETVNRMRHGGEVSWSNVTRPDARRDRAKAPIRERVRSPAFAALLARAEALYREMIAA